MVGDVMKIVLAVFIGLSLFGCDQGSSSVQHKRDPAFFNRFVNPAKDFAEAEAKLGELKLLVSQQKYKMRYALFDNGKFYYQVDNLGDGQGQWSYRDGALNLFAARMMFDLDLNLVAAKPEGDEMAMQFLDRFGNNTVPVSFKPGSAKPLRRFSSHPSGSL